MDAEKLTDRTLEQALESVTRFVLGVNSLPVVRAILKPRGLTNAEIDRASGLIQEVLAIRMLRRCPAQGARPNNLPAPASAWHFA